MKGNIGKILYQLLLLFVGFCLIIGGIINIKKHNSYLVIAGGFIIGVGMVILAIRGFVKITRA